MRTLCRSWARSWICPCCCVTLVNSRGLLKLRPPHLYSGDNACLTLLTGWLQGSTDVMVNAHWVRGDREGHDGYCLHPRVYGLLGNVFKV